MATHEIPEQAAELVALFHGMTRADRDAVLRFARIRQAKYQASAGGSAAVLGNLTVATIRNSRGALFDSVRGKI